MARNALRYLYARGPAPGWTPGLALILVTALASLPVLGQPIASYRTLDNIEGSHVDLLFGAVRPLARAQDGTLFAVNSHDSTVRVFSPTFALLDTWRVPWGPVSVGLWDGAGGGEEVLVVSRGTHALVRLDRATGAVRGLVELPSEPADLLVDSARDRAFVACSGADSVVQIDLTTDSIAATFPIDSKHPVFLAWDGDDVLVAPQLSGNNTTVDLPQQIFDAGPRGVLDLTDPAIASAPLPDEDLFRIDPDAASPQAEAVVSAAGMVLFGHGVNPQTGDHWLLNTEGKNGGPFGEPLLRGDFIDNRLSISTLPLAGGPAVPPHTILNLDDGDPTTPGVQFDPTRTVGQPYNLAFSAASGDAFLTGLLTDNVTWLDSSGAWRGEWNLREGCVPRGLLVADRGGAPAQVVAHCWNLNEVEVWDVSGASPSLAARLDLGHDPTPALARTGRTIFYDAATSEHNNATCASCHVDGATDMMPWYLGEPPMDDKGPLITQTLRGIEQLLPYHWRGERADLVDFNAAFDDLLGGARLGGADFAAFEAFVFQLQNPANPVQDHRRVVNAAIDDLRHPTGLDPDAVAGQDLWFDVDSVGLLTCNECHTAPTGTNSEIIRDEGGAAVKRRFFKTAPISTGMWRKEQPTRHNLTIIDSSGTPVPVELPTLGSGLSVTGLAPGLFDFVDIATSANPFSAQMKVDLASFVAQWDSGLAPCTHRGWLFDSSTAAQVEPQLSGYLATQAFFKNCDIVVFGTVDLGQGSRELAWFWDRRINAFVGEDTTVGPRDLSFFHAQALVGSGSNVFLGVPVGLAERFAVDFDADDLYNLDEQARGTGLLVADSDGDGWWDGHEVKNSGDPTDPAVGSADSTPPIRSNLRFTNLSGRVAKVLVHSDEPTQAVLTYQAASSVIPSVLAPPRFSRFHTLLVRDLEPGETYAATLDLVDLGGNGLVSPPAGPFTALARTNTGKRIVKDLRKGPIGISIGGGGVTFRVRAKVESVVGVPLDQAVLEVSVYVNDVAVSTGLQGPPGDAAGNTWVQVTQNGLNPGDVIRVVIDDVLFVDAAGQLQGGNWSFPDTLAEDREVSHVF